MTLRSLVTVAIPAYNGASLIRQAIESVLRQTYTHIELLIVDDHSTDDTGAVVRSFTDHRIRYIQNQTNLGLAHNFNRALYESAGEYICFLSQDDCIEVQFIEWAVNELDSHANATFAFAATQFTGQRAGRRTLPFNGLMDGRLFVETSLGTARNLVFLCGALVRKEVACKIGIESYIFFDWTFWLRLASMGNVIYTPTVLSTHFYHKEKATQQFMTSYYKHYIELRTAVTTFADHEELDEDLRKLVEQCQTRLFSIYMSLLAHDTGVNIRKFVRELINFSRVPVNPVIKLRRLIKTVVTRAILQFGRA